MLAAFWPVGLYLLFSKLFGSDKKKMDASPTAVPLEPNMNQKGRVPPFTPQVKGSVPPIRPPMPIQRVSRPPLLKKSNARKLKIIGGVLTFLGASSVPELLDKLLWTISGKQTFIEYLRYDVLDFFPLIGMLIGGIVMLVAGFSMDKAMKRYSRYLTVMGERAAMDVGELSRTLGFPEDQVTKDLQKMIDRGYFGGRAYLNVELGYLFRSGEADAEFQRQMQAAAEQASQNRKTEAGQTADAGYAGMLRKIHQANMAIPDPVLSAKVDRLEAVTAKIFQAVEQDPKKRDKIDKFLNYYLPTTQKLLDSYVQFESAGVEGENLRQAKSRIESTMDAIVAGFEHQLDALYQADAMDVTTDIDVMESMLHRDTATVEQDFRLDDDANQGFPLT